MDRQSETYGYARVSTKEQNLNRQLDALRQFGIDDKRVYADKASGRDFERPAYKRLMRKMKAGDVLVVKSIDRLGRDYEEILKEWSAITKVKHASIVVIDMPLLDTRETESGITGKFIADLVLEILSYVAQIERDNIRQRQAEGIAAAKARGVKFGRPAIAKPPTYEGVLADFNAGKINRRIAAEKLGVSMSTFDSWRKER